LRGKTIFESKQRLQHIKVEHCIFGVVDIERNGTNRLQYRQHSSNSETGVRGNAGSSLADAGITKLIAA
jgi:hypothetical protein